MDNIILIVMPRVLASRTPRVLLPTPGMPMRMMLSKA